MLCESLKPKARRCCKNLNIRCFNNCKSCRYFFLKFGSIQLRKKCKKMLEIFCLQCLLPGFFKSLRPKHRSRLVNGRKEILLTSPTNVSFQGCWAKNSKVFLGVFKTVHCQKCIKIHFTSHAITFQQCEL